MSTQSIRSIITNQVSRVISNGKDQIEEEGRKKIDELTTNMNCINLMQRILDLS